METLGDIQQQLDRMTAERDQLKARVGELEQLAATPFRIQRAKHPHHLTNWREGSLLVRWRSFEVDAMDVPLSRVPEILRALAEENEIASATLSPLDAAMKEGK